MFKIGDRVKYKKTGEVGTVIGYGHQMVDHFYLITIKVRLSRETGFSPIVEELLTEWLSLKREVSAKSPIVSIA